MGVGFRCRFPAVGLTTRASARGQAGAASRARLNTVGTQAQPPNRMGKRRVARVSPNRALLGALCLLPQAELAWAQLCTENEHVVSGACTPCAWGTSRPAGDDVSSGHDTECYATCATVSHADCGPGYRAARGDCVCANSEGLTDEAPDSSMCAAHAGMWGITGYEYCLRGGPRAGCERGTFSTSPDCTAQFCGSSGSADGCVYEGAVTPQEVNWFPILPTVPLAATCAGAICDVANVAADRAACCVAFTATTAVDCAGSWSGCTAVCELAADRTWTETVAQVGGGAACPPATDCASGEGACVIAATCGDADGAGAASAAVSDDDCGPGFFADQSAAAAAAHCVGAACDVSGTPADKAACCVPSSAACVGQCCEADTRANAMKAWWCVARGVCH